MSCECSPQRRLCSTDSEEEGTAELSHWSSAPGEQVDSSCCGGQMPSCLRHWRWLRQGWRQPAGGRTQPPSPARSTDWKALSVCSQDVATALSPGLPRLPSAPHSPPSRFAPPTQRTSLLPNFYPVLSTPSDPSWQLLSLKIMFS